MNQNKKEISIKAQTFHAELQAAIEDLRLKTAEHNESCEDLGDTVQFIAMWTMSGADHHGLANVASPYTQLNHMITLFKRLDPILRMKALLELTSVLREETED